jgi:hypothetical protein
MVSLVISRRSTPLVRPSLWKDEFKDHQDYCVH